MEETHPGLGRQPSEWGRGLPDLVFAKILALCETDALLLTVPLVCRWWRDAVPRLAVARLCFGAGAYLADRLRDDSLLSIVTSRVRCVEGLDLGDCIGLSDQSLWTIGRHCPQLQSLAVPRTRRRPGQKRRAGLVSLAAGLGPHSKLQHLDLRQVDHLADAEPTEPPVQGLLRLLASCAGLRTLVLPALGLQDATCMLVLAQLVHRCEHVQMLDLCPLDDVCVAELKHIVDASRRAAGAGSLAELRCLKADRCRSVSAAAWEPLLLCFPRLSALTLANCRVDNGLMAAIGTHCQHLLSIDVSGCASVEDEGLTALAQGCPDLRDVNVALCCVTDTGLASLALHCSGLRSLQAGRNAGRDITARGIEAVLRGCRHLRELSLEQCHALATGNLLAVFRHAGPALSRVTVPHRYPDPETLQEGIRRASPGAVVCRPGSWAPQGQTRELVSLLPTLLTLESL